MEKVLALCTSDVGYLLPNNPSSGENVFISNLDIMENCFNIEVYRNF